MNDKYQLEGQKFGRLTVLQRKGSDRHKKALWYCKCDCGGEKTTTTGQLKRGATKSCGCLDTEHRENFVRNNTKHMMDGTPEYWAWKHIKDRCYNPESQYYYLYGGRGISVCNRWLESFLNFYEDMGTRPRDCTSIERIDGNGNYCPENCRWADYSEQSRNTSQNWKITIDGETKVLTDWAKESPVTAGAIRHRIRKLGWSEKEAVFRPSKDRSYRQAVNFYKYQGESYSATELCDMFNIGKTTFRRNLMKGKSVEEIVEKYRRD